MTNTVQGSSMWPESSFIPKSISGARFRGKEGTGRERRGRRAMLPHRGAWILSRGWQELQKGLSRGVVGTGVTVYSSYHGSQNIPHPTMPLTLFRGKSGQACGCGRNGTVCGSQG